jgi:psiF repeat
MRRYSFISAMPIAMLAVMLATAPSFAASAKDKMATCKFGADDQKLAGAARNTFMKKCMSNHDDPRGQGGGTPAAAAVPPPPKQ